MLTITAIYDEENIRDIVCRVHGMCTPFKEHLLLDAEQNVALGQDPRSQFSTHRLAMD